MLPEVPVGHLQIAEGVVDDTEFAKEIAMEAIVGELELELR